MISVEEALTIVQNNSNTSTQFETKKVVEASGYTLSEDVVSPINMPPFRQSAMDGYALCLHDKATYIVVGEIKAGDSHHPILNKGEAVRIFTGAPVPDTANAVIMQEKVIVETNLLKLNSQVLIDENIRPLGEQVLKGKMALLKGSRLNPAAIAFLSSLGIEEVKVFKSPSIAIVVTGNELVEPGQDLGYGQIYESNAAMLSTSLNGLGFKNVSLYKAIDTLENTLETLKKVIIGHDIILVSGGISVGDYDFVGEALLELGVEQLFYKVNQKPGQPLFFGKKETKMIFALPGNPAAALSCFYLYVYPALQKMCGNENFSLCRLKAISETNHNKKGNRPQFLKAIYNNGKVKILEGQNSSMLHTFALANALVYAPETTETIKINDTVEVILLPIN